MPPIETLSEHACYGGIQGFYQHQSTTIGLPMRFGVYRPAQAADRKLPVLFYLAGLTCTEETFAIKAGAQRHAAKHGLMLVTPDTSPRDTGIDGEAADWDFGAGAGFYLDATRAPWSRHWQMESYISQELPELVAWHFPAQAERAGIFGHSMGGHGALTLALKHPTQFRSVSAFAPIASPMHCPWGHKALAGYLGEPGPDWLRHDTVALLGTGARTSTMLVDQGLADNFLAPQLNIDLLESTCTQTGQALKLRRHDGYDHGYYFIASFVADHIAHHAAQLT